MKLLISGGAGYLGSILVPALLAEGHHVTVVDNFLYGQASLNHCCYRQDFEVVRGDVRDESLMKKLLAEADIIIPLAAIVGAPACRRDPTAAKSINFNSMLSMMSWLSHDQRVIMPTTNSAYGTGDLCTEESPLNPLSSYARDKVEVEKVLMQHENAISFRLATVFGMSPRMRLDLLVNDFVYRAVNDRFIVLFEAHFRRNYIHVRDVCRAFLHGIEHFDGMRGQIYNVGLSDANLTKLHLCELIHEYLPDFVYAEAAVGKDPDQRDYIVSNAKIEATGFETAYTVGDGIQELVKGYQCLRNTRYGNV
jgi:nucleoside-diphosphate-sugar epimerase